MSLNNLGHAGARIAFFGWCDAAFDVPFLAPGIVQTNIKGLSVVRASHVYPLSLKENIAVYAVFQPAVGEMFKLVFRDTQGFEAFFLEFGMGSIEEIKPDGTVTPLPPGTQLPGWFFHHLNLNANAVVNEPGEYKVFHSTIQGEMEVGKIMFVHVPVAEFTSEEITAIRSDPLALKLIRISLECSVCADCMKAYAGLEKNEKLEAEGWIRDAGLPERFKCKCGASNFALVYIKTGLRGLLRRRALPTAKGDLGYIRMYEKTALEQKCKSFHELLEGDGHEERLQEFLEQNPIFFARFNPQRLMFKSPVLSMRKVDFAILNERKELLLIEIENSSTRLLKNDGGICAEVQHAADQVRDWLQKFADHRAAALECLGLKLEDVAKVSGVVIAGRTPKDDREARSLRSISWTDIEFFTFDDLLSGAVEIIRHFGE